jgi:hypothetical protein
MISRESANDVADAVLEPSRQALEARKAKLAERKSASAVMEERRGSPVFPAAIAAVAAVIVMDLGASAWLAIVAGATAGWAFGAAAKRTQRRASRDES